MLKIDHRKVTGTAEKLLEIREGGRGLPGGSGEPPRSKHLAFWNAPCSQVAKARRLVTLGAHRLRSERGKICTTFALAWRNRVGL
jgi:hypothetical protein